MIEALVRYFEAHGFKVFVLPGVLLIRKECAEEDTGHPMIIGWDWAVPQIDLQNRGLNDYLFDYAEQIIVKLNEAIAAHEAQS